METDEGFYQKNSRTFFGRHRDRHCNRYSAFTPLVYFPWYLFNLVWVELIPVRYMLTNYHFLRGEENMKFYTFRLPGFLGKLVKGFLDIFYK